MSELRFTEDHEWLRTEADGSVTVGITAFAQHALGDVVFVQLPELGLRQRRRSATVESVKAASGVYMPLDGEVVEVNPALDASPELVNEDPLGEGWFFRFQPADASASPAARSGRLRPPDQSQRRSLRSAT
jgi:glycine cleavage system H protein